MTAMENQNLIGPDDLILITGATGFIGTRLVDSLTARGFRNLRCFTRPSSDAAKVGFLSSLRERGVEVSMVTGNLLSREDCRDAVKGAKVIYHLAAGRGEKSFSDAYMNSVVTTRNLIEAALEDGSIRRFVNISSFTVYSNQDKPNGRRLDETCPVEPDPKLRGEAYCFAKTRQDELVMEYGRERGLPYVIVRPGYVYGPGKHAITGRVGVDTFGVFLHMGGGNRIPFTYIENCADAIALSGIRAGVDGEIFNIVDDDLPSSRQFLRLYKREVKRFRSFYVPHSVSYLLCWIWQKYSASSHEQIPPAFNIRRWHANWKKTAYSNEKCKRLLGWTMRVPTAVGLNRFFEDCRAHHA